MKSDRDDTMALVAENARLRSELAEVTQKLKLLQESSGISHVSDNRMQAVESDITGYQTIKNQSDDAVILTSNGVIVSMTPQFADRMHSPLETMVGRSFFDFVRLGCNEQFFAFLHRSLETIAHTDLSLVTRKGEEIQMALTGRPHSFGEKKGISLTFQSHATRNKAEEALRRSEERLQTLAELTSDVLWEFNAATDDVWRSEGLAELLGYAPTSVRPTLGWWRENIHPDDRAKVFLELDKILKSGQGQFHQTYRVRKADGSYAEISNRAVAIRDEQTRTVRLIGSIVDVTEENKAQAAQREISKKILQAQEQERQRVARELHDGVNQLLSSSSYRLNSLEQQIATHDAGLAQKIVQAKDLIEKAMSEVRLISRNLRPSELDDLGLNAALRSLCGDFKKRTGIKMHTVCQDFARALPPNVEMTIYRIAQEALNNVEKHAGAKSVYLSLKGGDDGIITLKIRDTGRGFDPESARKGPNSGWGLDNMRERASLFQGKIKLVSAPQKGTEVVLTIPAS